MFSQPPEVTDEMLDQALWAGWRFRAATLTYQPVGFGAHHWLGEDTSGRRLFITVDDLAARTWSAQDTIEAAFSRLERAMATAFSLRHDAGLEFVVAPIQAADGRTLHRMSDRYSIVTHPYLADCEPGRDGDFAAEADRRAVIALLQTLHGVSGVVLPRPDDLTVPQIAQLKAAMSRTQEPWQRGPYGTRARDLLAAHVEDLAALLVAFGRLAARVAGRADRLVITHGEPGAANVLRTPRGFVFVDWESVLLAQPERDLWALAEDDPEILTHYSERTGVAIDTDALTAYRLWYDLFEIAGYITWFEGTHEDNLDTAEAWQNLQHFLQPADRWPDLVGPAKSGRRDLVELDVLESD